MLGPGLVGGLIAKLAGLGSAAKVAVATATAALTLTVAAGAAAVLPLGAGDSGPGIDQNAMGQAAAVTQPLATPTTEAAEVQASADASVTTPAGSAAAAAAADAAGAVETAPSSPIPSLPLPGTDLVDVGALAEIPTQVLACLTPILDLVTGLPAVSVQQITQIGPGVVGCVSGIVEALPLPMGLNACVSEILGFVSDMASHLPTGTPGIGGLNIAACIPTGLPVPTGLPGMEMLTGGGFPFGFGSGFPFGG